MGHRTLPVLAALSLLTGCAGHGWLGPPSDHFDGERFFNPGIPFDKSPGDLLYYLAIGRDPGDWDAIDVAPGPAPPARVSGERLLVTPVNHATVLIQTDGLNLLTDPIYSERASPLSWAGPRRSRAPGIRFEDLPPIDVVMVSHNHYDHLDLPTLARLVERFDPLLIVPLGDRGVVDATGSARIVELDWWQSIRLPHGPRLWGLPSVHWSGRFPVVDRNRSLWLAYLLESPGGPVYFAGDTGYGEHFAIAGERFGPIRLALLPIGAYEPRWLVGMQHMEPAEAARAHLDLLARRTLGIAHGTFELSDVGRTQPRRDLARARATAGITPGDFAAAAYGRGVEIGPLNDGKKTP